MRILLLFLIGLSLTFPLLAQEPSEEPSELEIQIEETPPPATPTNETSVSTNRTLESKLSFLVDTGIQYAEEGEHEEAERAYLRALEEAPDNSVIRFRLSTLYIMMGRYIEAVPILEALVVEFPDNAQVRNNLAWAYATGPGVKNTKLALRHAREAILLAPIAPSMWNTLAEAYYVGGDYDKALRASEHAIDLLIQTDLGQKQMPDFQTQHTKILRAQEALKRFDGLDDED